MKITKIALAASVLISLSLFKVANAAQLSEGSFVVSPFANYTWYASKRDMKNAGGFGLALGYATNNNLLISASVASNKSKQRLSPYESSRVMQYAVDGNYYFNPVWGGLQPYLGGGVGVWHLQRPLHNAPKTQTNLHANAGAAYFFTQNIGIQAGGQYFYTVTDGGRNDFVVNGGVVLRFGGGSTKTK